ncbi:MAG: DUF1464 family protein [Desulfurococcaceae archaeon]
MVRIVGIDPGTKTFDVVALEDNAIKVERSFDTPLIASNPQVLVEAVDALNPDYVVAPSGYGVPVTFGDNVLDARRFAVEVLLLSTEEDISAGIRSGEVGIWVYDALAKVVSHLVSRYGGKTLFLPAVIHLPTIPRYRKINKIDMGTVDKLASTFLAVYEVSEKYGYDTNRVNIVVAELGYGYTATIAVKNGVIVDGVGGTYASTGMLTPGAVDFEVVVGAKTWKRWDVFHGGVLYGTELRELDEIIRRFENGEEPYASMFKAFIEGVVKDINRMIVSTPGADMAVLTGRHGKNAKIAKYIGDLLKDVEVVTLRGLKGASKAKEAAQGYAAIGEGIVGTWFKDLVKYMGVESSCGASVDYVIHPRAREFVARVRKAYIETVRRPKLCNEA